MFLLKICLRPPLILLPILVDPVRKLKTNTFSTNKFDKNNNASFLTGLTGTDNELYYYYNL